MASSDSRLADFLTAVPAPGDDAVSRLAHTLACYEHLGDLSAVGISPLTWGDLRALGAGQIRPHLAQVAAGSSTDGQWLVTATLGAYGVGVRTGLTWGDLRALLAA